MTFDKMSKKSASIYSILALIILVGPYTWGLLPSYARASDLKAHIVSSDKRYQVTMRRELKKQIKGIKNELALYELDSNMRPLSPREKLHVTQLKNLKDEYIQELSEPSLR